MSKNITSAIVFGAGLAVGLAIGNGLLVRVKAALAG